MMHPARGLFLLAAALLVVPSVAWGQDAQAQEKRRKSLLEGTHFLRRILYDEKVKPLERFEDLTRDDARHTLVVVLGDLNAIEEIPEGLVSFVRAGGAVLLASDRPVTGQSSHDQLAALAGVEVAEGSLLCQNLALCYKGKDFCPFALPVAGASPPLFADPRPMKFRVATNVPSNLREIRGRLPGDVQRLAVLPPPLLRLHDGDEGVSDEALFAVAGTVGEGRFLVMADHSVFINEMMLPPDNYNVEFASSAVAWLRGLDPARDQVLFVDNGTIIPDLYVPLKSVSIPAEEALRLLFSKRNEILATGGNVVARLEDEGAFDRKTLEVLEAVGLSPARLARVALIGATLVALAYAVYRVGIRGRFRHDPSVPLLAESLDRGLPVAALATQRYLLLAGSGNLAEPATHLARVWFSHLGVHDWGGPLPAVEGGPWWRRWRMRSRLGRVWRLAAGRVHRVTPHQLGLLTQELARLRSAHERGLWRLSAGVMDHPGGPGKALWA